MDKLVLVKRAGRDVLAVKEQVDREAVEAWGKRQYKPFYTVPVKAQSWSPTALHVLKSQLWRMVA